MEFWVLGLGSVASERNQGAFSMHWGGIIIIGRLQRKGFGGGPYEETYKES